MKSLPEIPGDAQFFRAFARFEYALKSTGYYERSNWIRTNWAKFEKERSIQGLFEAACGNSGINYLINHPPKREIVENGTVAWKEPEKIETTQALLKALQRVRNNLFHGGKRPSPKDRDRRLIRAAMKVLEMLLDRCPELKAKFDEA